MLTGPDPFFLTQISVNGKKAVWLRETSQTLSPHGAYRMKLTCLLRKLILIDKRRAEKGSGYARLIRGMFGSCISKLEN